MNIFEFAMNMELDGKVYYEKLSQSTADEMLKTIFDKLADQELDHYNIIKQFKETQEFTSERDMTEIDNLFEILMDNTNMTPDMDSQKEAYQHACTLEDESIDFYIEQRDNSTDEGEILLFDELIIEEKKHKLLLENIIEYISKPENLRGQKTVDSDPEFSKWDQ